jgi:hypothetical protein
MVHERLSGGPPGGLGGGGTATSTATIDADTVFKIEEGQRPAGVASDNRQ